MDENVLEGWGHIEGVELVRATEAGGRGKSLRSGRVGLTRDVGWGRRGVRGLSLICGGVFSCFHVSIPGFRCPGCVIRKKRLLRRGFADRGGRAVCRARGERNRM